jgi:membrane associated rhomboid family serine protease
VAPGIVQGMTQPQQPVAYGCYRHPDRATYIRCQRCGRPICGDCMISAAVGFQCPECVATFAKQTRQHEGPFGGTRSTNPRLTTIVLIGINVAVWALILIGGDAIANLLALQPGGFCLSATDPTQWFPGATTATRCAIVGGAWQAGVASGAWWQVITSAFTHVQVWHIGMNMLSLWFLGPPMETALGRTRFLAAYLLSALAGSAAVMWFAEPTTQTLGASGAVFGLIGALIVVGLKIKADLRVAFTWLAINLVFTFVNAGISWQGHIGGLLGGMAATAIIVYAPRENRSRVQWLGLAGLAVATIAAIVVRAAQLA